MGWTFPWASSFGSDFNSDYSVGLTEAQQDQGYDYNFVEKPPIPRDRKARRKVMRRCAGSTFGPI